jgi:uncharacterized protein (DUF2147 family)
MTKRALLILPLLTATFIAADAQQLLGKWKTIDDNSGKPKSVVEFYERNGKVYGKIVALFREPGEDPDPVCTKCESDDERHGKKVIGMTIVRNMVKEGAEYTGGDILDPEVGKVYRCKLWIEDNQLMVRGYWGPFFRTQVWSKTE